MNIVIRAAGAAALAAASLAVSAASASAYTYSTHFTATNTSDHVMTAGGAPLTCTTATYSGDSPVSGATVQFRPSYSGCIANLIGLTFPATITAASDWTATPLTGVGPFSGSIAILAPASGNALTLSIPALACEVYVNAQTLSTLTMTNAMPGVDISANVSGISYTNNGCPGLPASGNDATYTGQVAIPNATINN